MPGHNETSPEDRRRSSGRSSGHSSDRSSVRRRARGSGNRTEVSAQPEAGLPLPGPSGRGTPAGAYDPESNRRVQAPPGAVERFRNAAGTPLGQEVLRKSGKLAPTLMQVVGQSVSLSSDSTAQMAGNSVTWAGITAGAYQYASDGYKNRSDPRQVTVAALGLVGVTASAYAQFPTNNNKTGQAVAGNVGAWAQAVATGLTKEPNSATSQTQTPNPAPPSEHFSGHSPMSPGGTPAQQSGGQTPTSQPPLDYQGWQPNQSTHQLPMNASTASFMTAQDYTATPDEYPTQSPSSYTSPQQGYFDPQHNASTASFMTAQDYTATPQGSPTQSPPSFTPPQPPSASRRHTPTSTTDTGGPDPAAPSYSTARSRVPQRGMTQRTNTLRDPNSTSSKQGRRRS